MPNDDQNFIQYGNTRIDQNSDPSLLPRSTSPVPALSQASMALPSGFGGQAMPQQKNPPSISSALMPSPISGFRDSAFEGNMASLVNAAFHGSNMRREQAMNQQMPLLLLEGMRTIGAIGGADGFGGLVGGKGAGAQYSNIYNGHLRALTGSNQGLNPLSPEEASQKAHQMTADYFKALGGGSIPGGKSGSQPGSVNDLADSVSQSRGGAGVIQPQSDWKSDAQRNMMSMFLSSIEGLYGKKYTSSFGHEYTTGQMPPEIQKNIATLKSMLASSGAVATPAVQNIPKPQQPIDYRSTPRQPAPLDEPNQSGTSAISTILKFGGNPISALLTNLLFKKINGQQISPTKQEQPSGSGGW